MISAPGDRRDEDIREIATIAAGHFDHYICRCDDSRRGRGDDEVAIMQKEALIAAGIPDDRIEVITDEQAATQHALEIAEEGDLVLVLGDNVKRVWKQIIYFKSGKAAAGSSEKSRPEIELPELAGFDLDGDIEIISDERGVRIAREEGD